MTAKTRIIAANIKANIHNWRIILSRCLIWLNCRSIDRFRWYRMAGLICLAVADALTNRQRNFEVVKLGADATEQGAGIAGLLAESFDLRLGGCQVVLQLRHIELK